MSTASNIEWTDATWNPVTGCTRVSRGCDHCYAVTMTHRLEGMGQEKYKGLTVLNPRLERHFNGQVRCHEDALAVPLSWRKPRRVFVNSMSDLFHAKVSFEFIDKVFAVMALTPRHTYQVLTKRPERMAEYFDASRSESMRPGRVLREAYTIVKDAPGTAHAVEYAKLHQSYHADYARSGFWPLPNVWLGTSCEDQAAADERVPHLLKCPAAVRFLSCEPLLGAIDLGLPRISKIQRERGVGYVDASRIAMATPKPDWVITGGESGMAARPCDIAWIRSIVGQCRAAGVACFVKQLGSNPMMRADSIEGRRRGDHPESEWPDGTSFSSRAGLDRQWDGRAVLLDDPKGGDMAEWPEDLRVREFPAGINPPASAGGSTKAVRA